MSKKKEINNMFIVEGQDTQPKKTEENNLSSDNEVKDINSHSGKKNYNKKKRGIFAEISKWWKNRKKWEKALIILLLSILTAICIIIGSLFLIFNYNYNSITKNPDDLGFENVIDKDIINIALFGIDTRDKKSFKGNSDSIMILSLNTNTKKVKIISIMRDSFVPIEQENNKIKYNKINSAYAKGGPELAIKTINSCFGLDISEYATVNFFGMADIIDAVGGIEVELTKKEVSKDRRIVALNACIDEICKELGLNPKNYYFYKSGTQHLNGVQAVAYSRIRYVSNIWGTNNDYGRTDRQRFVMEQLFNKALTTDKSRYPALIKSLIPCAETSLSYKQILGLAFNILGESPVFEQARIPQDDYTMTAPKTSAGSVVYYDINFAEKLIHAFIYDNVTPEQYIETNGVEKNDWYRKQIGGNNSVKPGNTTGKKELGVSNKDESPISESSSQEPVSSNNNVIIEDNSKFEVSSENTTTSIEQESSQIENPEQPDDKAEPPTEENSSKQEEAPNVDENDIPEQE